MDAAPEEAREDLREVVPYLGMFVLMNDRPDHTRLRRFLHRGFNAEAIRGLRARIQQVADELLGDVQDTGHIAPRNLIGNVVYLLLTHPDQFAKLKGDPSLLSGAIEETLRYEPPVTLILRIASEDIELRRETIGAGQIVQLSIASANRDPSRFPDPDRFDITKERSPTLSFGHGPHGWPRRPARDRGSRDLAGDPLQQDAAPAPGRVSRDKVVPQRRQPRPRLPSPGLLVAHGPRRGRPGPPIRSLPLRAPGARSWRSGPRTRHHRRGR